MKNASLTEYVYDRLANKYGIGKLAERKLKEVFVTCLKNCELSFKVELFQRFLGISAKKDLSNDDLSHFYFLNRLFLANECFDPHPQQMRKEYCFESDFLWADKAIQAVETVYS